MFNKYRKQFAIAFVSYTGFVLFGYTAGWSTPVVEKITKTPNLIGEGITSSQLSWLVSAVFVGAIIGTIPLGYLANIIGRKKTLVVGAAISPPSYICLALIKNINAMIFFRVILGVTLCNVLVVNLVYLGEIASTEIRGIILGSSGISISVGLLISFAVGHYVTYEVMNYIGLAISLAYLIGMFYVTESPLFLTRKGREEEAKSVLLDLNRKDDADNLSNIKFETEASQNVKWTQLLTVKCNRKALFITCVLYFLQQFSGIAPMLAYTTTIFELAGSSIPPHLATIIIGTVQVLSGFITPLFIERYGRRFLLLLSTMLTCLSLAVLSVYLNLDAYGNPVVDKLKWLPLVMAIMYFVSYSFGLGIIPATLVGEMFQLHLRSVGSSVVLLTNFLGGFATTYAFGALVAGAGVAAAFITFAVACACAFFFALAFVPETKGKSLVEVQKMLNG